MVQFEEDRREFRPDRHETVALEEVILLAQDLVDLREDHLSEPADARIHLFRGERAVELPVDVEVEHSSPGVAKRVTRRHLG